MLVISRKTGDSILIGESIRITVLSQSGDKVTLGVDAPREISIVREELLETIEANLRSSEKIDPGHYKDLAALLQKGKGE